VFGDSAKVYLDRESPVITSFTPVTFSVKRALCTRLTSVNCTRTMSVGAKRRLTFTGAGRTYVPKSATFRTEPSAQFTLVRGDSSITLAVMRVNI